MILVDLPAPPPAVISAQASSIKAYDAAFFADFKADTALDMVRKLPAFTLDYGAAVRGFAGSDSNIRIDGQQPASRDSIDAILRRIPAANVARIEIISGSAPGVDMQGRSVVANVVRRGPEGIKGTASVSVGLNQLERMTGSVQVQAERRANGRMLEGSFAYTRYIDEANGLRLRGLNLDIPAIYIFRGFGDLGTGTAAFEMPLLGGQLRLTTAASAQFSPTTRDVAGAAPSYEYNGNHLQTGEVGARWTRNGQGGGFLQLIAFQQQSHTTVDQDFTQGATHTQFGVENTKGESILRAITRSARHGDFVLDGSLEGDFNWLDTSTRFVNNGVNFPLPAGQVRVEETRGEALANLTWTPKPALNVQIGVRLEGSHVSSEGAVALSKTKSSVKPRFVAAWTLGSGKTLTLRAERQVSQLSFDDFSATASLTNGTLVTGNPDLAPSITKFYEVRYEQRFAGRGALALQYNHRDIQDLVGRNIFVTPLGTYEAADNIGPGTRDAVSASLTTPLDRFNFKGGQFKVVGAWRQSEVTDPLTGRPHRFSNESAYDYAVTLSQDKPGSRLSWSVETIKVSVYPTFLTSEIDNVERSHRINAQIDYKLRPDLGLRIEGLNLTDWRYTGTREIYSAPRNTGVVINRELVRSNQIGDGRMIRLSLRKTF